MHAINYCPANRLFCAVQCIEDSGDSLIMGIEALMPDLLESFLDLFQLLLFEITVIMFAPGSL